LREAKRKYKWLSKCKSKPKSDWGETFEIEEAHQKKLLKELPPDYSSGVQYIDNKNNYGNFETVESKSRYNKNFKAWQIDYKIHISSNVDLKVLNNVIFELINTIKQRTLFQNGDKIDLIITNPYLYHPISTGLMTINDDNNPII
jgi:hypothetical protein